MRTLLIAYDVADADVSAELARIIRQIGVRWARPLATLWLVETDASAEAVEAELAHGLGVDDGLLVQAAAGPAALCNAVVRWTRSRTSQSTMTAGQAVAWHDASHKIATAA